MLKHKLNALGQITKFKARLVVKGFKQAPGTDFLETFTAITIPLTWRLLLALTAINNWEAELVDFIRAFLNRDLPKTIYSRLPEGLIALLANLKLL